MNLILFEPEEWEGPLSSGDFRITHLKKVLRRGPAEEFDAGVVNGPRGRGWIKEERAGEVLLGFRPTGQSPPLFPLILAVGASRPQTARKILLQATSLGVKEIHFFASEKGEGGYLKSRIYQAKLMRPYLLEGAGQAFSTRLPRVEIHPGFLQCLERLSEGPGVGLDNYEAPIPLHSHGFPSTEDIRERPLTLWVGSERGWSAAERNLLRSRGFPLRGLGPRVLRTETAVVAGIALCLAGLEEASQGPSKL